MGRSDEALVVLQQAALYNGTPLDDLTLSTKAEQASPEISPFSILFHRTTVVVTASVWCHWFFYGFCYYSVILFSMRVFADTEHTESSAHVCSFQYGELFFGALVEVGGVLCCTLVIDRYGRLPTLRWSYGLCALSAFTLSALMPILPTSMVTLISYVARCSILCGVSSTWLSTPEYFSTSTRVTGHAIASGVSRVGSFLAPFVTQSSASTREVALILALASLAVVLSTIFLPETRGMALGEANSSSPRMKMRSRRLLNLLQKNRYEYLDEAAASSKTSEREEEVIFF
jgi:hypothetical protein